jgi:tRNA(Ile)-lysidine synthetase-like protein
VRRELALALDRQDPAPGERWLVAFSGGPDSLALAAGLAPLAAARRLRLELVHVDHQIDSGSTSRATRAGEFAGILGLPFHLARLDVPALRQPGESLEVAARRLRYGALERLRRQLGASRILTAHQRDDQVETVLLRLLRGGPVESLAGIPERRGAIWRPLLTVPRAEIERFLAAAGLDAIEDPTNRDPAMARNLVRHHLLPRLRAEDPEIDALLLALGRRAAALAARLDTLFAERLKGKDQGSFVERQRLKAETKTSIEGEDRVGGRSWGVGAPAEAGGHGRSPAIRSPAEAGAHGRAMAHGRSPAVAAPAAAGAPDLTPERPRRLESPTSARTASSSSTEGLCLGVGSATGSDFDPGGGGPSGEKFSLEAAELLALPAGLRDRALRWRLAAAGLDRLPSRAASESFVARLARGERARLVWRVGEGAGGAWELRAAGGPLRLERRVAAAESRAAAFSYTFRVPGEVELPELGLRFRIRRSQVEGWMFHGDPRRAALALSGSALSGSGAERATVRSRRPGDRLRPLGGPGERKLKELLIDRRIPAGRRDRLPILEIGGRIAWVPGVTIDEAFRLRSGAAECLVAELEPFDRGGNGPPGDVVEPVERKGR